MQLSSNVFGELLESIIVDVASECHRIARLGLDRSLDNEEEEMRLSMEARAMDPSSSEANSKNVVDIFGQTHPAIASEIFDCMNCGRPVVAGRFAPHLEKCMGKVGFLCHDSMICQLSLCSCFQCSFITHVPAFLGRGILYI